jgi:hypothetical protein
MLMVDKVESILEKVVHPILKKYHLPLYHKDPEFHASFAWCLIRREQDRVHESAVPDKIDSSDSIHHEPISSQVINNLNDEFGKALLENQPKGGWHISSVEVKLAKDVITLPLYS